MKHKINDLNREMADLDATLEEFSESVDLLSRDRNLENARQAQWRNMESFHLLYDLYLMVGYVYNVTEKFLRDSHDCVAALSLVKEEDEFSLINYGPGNYIPLLIKNVERRIDLSDGYRNHGNYYVKRKLSELLDEHLNKRFG